MFIGMLRKNLFENMLILGRETPQTCIYCTGYICITSTINVFFVVLPSICVVRFLIYHFLNA